MKLTQNDLKYIIHESAKRVLNEISIRDAYARFYQDIPEGDYNIIVGKLSKGTLNHDGNTVLHPDAKWFLNLYRRMGEGILEDIYKLRTSQGNGYLDIFDRLKKRRMINGISADLNQYKTIAELAKFVTSFDIDEVMGRTKGEMSNAVHAAENDVKILYEDSEWKILTPNSYEASCYWGQGTEWCTATRETDEYYRRYTEKGPLFININKNNGARYQFHFETKQFMDAWDDEVDYPVLKHIGANDGVIDFYAKILPVDYMMNMKYEPLGEGVWLLEKNDKYNITNNEEYPLSDIWFDDVNYFYAGFAKVKSGAAMNYINPQGDLLSKEWFYGGTNFSRGWASVYNRGENGKIWNVLFDDGTIGCEFMWFDLIDSMGYKSARCCKDGIYLDLFQENKILVGGNKNHRVRINSVEDFYKYRKEIFKEYVRMRKESEEEIMRNNFRGAKTTTQIREILGIAEDYHITNNDLQ